MDWLRTTKQDPKRMITWLNAATSPAEPLRRADSLFALSLGITNSGIQTSWCVISIVYMPQPGLTSSIPADITRGEPRVKGTAGTTVIWLYELKCPDGDNEQTRWSYEVANERERSAVLVKTWQAPLERVILRIKATSDNEREHFLGRVMGYLAQDRLKEGSQVGTVSMGRIRGPTMKVLLFLSFIC
jgi:hypothetical protein